MIERLPKETDKAWQAFQDFYAMGQGRSIKVLHQQYSKQNRKKRNVTPTKSYKTIAGWSSTYKWDERVKVADKELEAERLQALKEEAHRKYLERIQAFRTVADQAAVAGIAGSSTLARIQSNIAKQAEQLLSNLAINDLGELEAIAKVLQTLNNSMGGNAKASNDLFDFKAKIEGLDQLLSSLGDD